ncbi:TraB/GumN family protein [Sphingomonas rosea]|uniref:TraB/GumN family protein n=1 Tax=Sphingomonas rosea TaxID=335605 RepID=A0ABP7U5R0_9SPHN
MAFGWLVKGLAALGLLSAGAVEARVPAPRPALWKVSDRDTTIYLFGTIHLLPRNYPWRSAALEKAADQSQGLIVETIVDEKNPQSFAADFNKLAISPGLPRLIDRVSADKRPAMAAMLAKAGPMAAGMDRLETWAAAMMLLGPQFNSAGLNQADGVETVLKQKFAAAGKPIGQLETNAEQLGFFDVLPEAAQRNLLEGALERPEEVRKQFDGMLAAWSRGDVKAIAATFNSEMSESPMLTEMLLKRRNENWSRWIQQRMAQPGTVMIAVGAGHLAGPYSVQTMLQKRGLKVTRVQ